MEFEDRRVRFNRSELGIIKGVASGANYDRIAEDLFLSKSTIAYHVGRIQRCLKVGNNAALVAFTIAAGLLAQGNWPPELTGLDCIDLP